MCPHSDDSKRVSLVNLRLSHCQVLDNSREVSQVELVMELLCSWHELRRHSNGQEHVHCSIDDVVRQLGNVGIELFHMVIKNLEVNSLEDVSLGSEARDNGSMSGQSKIDDEGSRLGVHASSEHDVHEKFLLLEMVSVIDEAVVDNLSDQANWRLGSVLIKVWHVVVIKEVDKSLTWWWSIGSTSSLVNIRLKDNLEGSRVSVGVKVHGSSDRRLFVELGEVILDNGGLTSTGGSDVDHSLLGSDVDVQQEGLSSGLGGWHHKVGEKTFVFGVELWSKGIPMFPDSLDNIIVVIEDLSTFWEFEVWIGDQ